MAKGLWSIWAQLQRIIRGIIMIRIAVRPRHNLDVRVQETGFEFHAMEGKPYWDESAYYAFSLKQIEEDLEEPSKELAAMSLELVDRVVGNENLSKNLLYRRLAFLAIGAIINVDHFAIHDPKHISSFS